MDSSFFEKTSANMPIRNNEPPVESVKNSKAKLGSMALSTSSSAETNSNSSPEVSAKMFLRRHGAQLSLFARDSSLRFEPSPDAETFAFYPKEFKVEVPLSWFTGEKYSEDELDFANHHELAHFIDMRKNPQAYLDNFETMEKEAEELAEGYLIKHPGQASKSAVNDFFYREIHNLYNVLDDIYVNNVVFSRSKFFDRGDGRSSVESLYMKTGFEEADQTSQPLHRQMIFSLLRDEMIDEAHGKSVVDEKVEEIFSKKKLGKTIHAIIDTELKPRQGVLIDPAERYAIIRKLIQPEYIKLLELALERQNEQENPSKSHDGHGEPQSNQDNQGAQSEHEGQDNAQDGRQNSQGEENQENDNQSNQQNGEFNPFNDENKTPPLDLLDHGENSEQVIKDILDSFKEADMVDKMSAEERAEYQRKKAMREFDDKHGITEDMRKQNETIKSEISSARKEMRKFWRRLVGKSIEYRQAIIKNQRKGRLDVNSYIQKYPDLIEAERNGSLGSLEIYERMGLERRIVDQPETIDISLLVDCSGSMDGSREEAARKTAALLMYSIKDFNDELARTRRETRSKLHANTEVIAFGSEFKEIKSFDRNQTFSQNDAEIIKSISEINSDYGRTDDASPLAEIISRLSTKEKGRIKQKKLKKIVFEITDGAPQDPEETSRKIKELTDEGVIAIGFQIGSVNANERITFDAIWNQDASYNKKGIYIGEKIDKLPALLMRELSSLLSNIVI